MSVGFEEHSKNALLDNRVEESQQVERITGNSQKKKLFITNKFYTIKEKMSTVNICARDADGLHCSHLKR